jgi:hypothetical protein
MFGRYFAYYIGRNAAGRQVPILQWSDPNPDPSQPATFSPGNFVAELPTHSERITVWGGILGDGNGHTFEDASASPPYTAFHLYYQAFFATQQESPFIQDIDHTLLFAYPLTAFLQEAEST